jgi:hypothetical protein
MTLHPIGYLLVIFSSVRFIVLFVGEWSRRRKVDVSGAGAAVDEERSVLLMKAGRAVSRWADSRSGFVSAFGEDLADAQNGSFSVGG